MLVCNSQREEFENWINNSSLKEPERKRFFYWIINSPIDISLLNIPPVRCRLRSGKFRDFYNGYVFDIVADIDYFDWMSYLNKEYSYITIDSEVIHYLNWIGDIPTGRFSIDQRTGYFHRKDYKKKKHIEKAYKKISVGLIKIDEKFHEIESEKKLNPDDFFDFF